MKKITFNVEGSGHEINTLLLIPWMNVDDRYIAEKNTFPDDYMV